MNWRYGYAIKNLVLKDFRIRYRNMALGVGWSVLNPLVMLGVLVFVFSYLFPQKTAASFPVFLLLGMIPFNFLQFCLTAGTGCFLDNAPLIKKMTFPRYILPVSVLLSQCIHIGIQIALLFVLIVALQVPITWHFLWLPAILVLEFCFIVGLTLLFSTLYVFYRDLLYMVQSGLTILFWLTPVFYDLGTTHQKLSRPLYLLYLTNPLVGYIEGLRRTILSGVGPERDSFTMALLVTAVTMALGLFAYWRAQARLADYV